MSQGESAGMDDDTAALLARWQQVKENDPATIVEDPEVEQDPLFLEIRAMIEAGLGGRLLNGRKN